LDHVTPDLVADASLVFVDQLGLRRGLLLLQARDRLFLLAPELFDLLFLLPPLALERGELLLLLLLCFRALHRLFALSRLFALLRLGRELFALERLGLLPLLALFAFA